MRDPDRIPLVLAAIGRTWTEHPDQRLGQLLRNSLYPTWDVFDVEDGELIKRVASYGNVALSPEQEEYVQREPAERKAAIAFFFERARRRFGFGE